MSCVDGALWIQILTVLIGQARVESTMTGCDGSCVECSVDEAAAELC